MPKGKRTKNPVLEADTLNFGLLRSDVNMYCKQNGVSMADISRDKLFRGDSYLSARLSERKITLATLTGICQVIGQPIKRYEIEKKPPEQPVQKHDEPASAWDCKLMVNTDFGIASFIILRNGEVFAKAHSKLRGTSDVDIAKSISYAAHVCYKELEQADFVNRIGLSDNDAYGLDAFAPSTPFKEYIRQFTGEKSGRGELARFVSNNYAKFPTWGEKGMRHFLTFSRASKQVVDAFDAEFDKYRKWSARG